MLSLSLCVVPRKVETSLHYNNPCYYYPTNITCQNKPQLYIEIEGRGRAFMMRTPCCEKMGLKKGPWTPDEDEKLLAYIQHHGHGSWRSLPKHAGIYTWFLFHSDINPNASRQFLLLLLIKFDGILLPPLLIYQGFSDVGRVAGFVGLII